MAILKCVIFSVLLILLMGCSRFMFHSNRIPTPDNISEIYPFFGEISFCLSDDGKVSNILEGNLMTAPPAWCLPEDRSMHTHPIYGECFAGTLDFRLWRRYNKIYEGTKFGVVCWRKTILYDLIDDKWEVKDEE